MPNRILRFGMRWAFVCLLTFIFLFTFSEPVRAGVLNWIKQIAGFEVQETDTLPVAEDTILVSPDVRGSLTEIPNDLPFAFAMPVYVPNGFVFEDKVDIHAQSIFMRWLNKTGDEILMQVNTEHGQRYLTGTDAAEEIQINGQPALLVPGGYDANNQWDPALPMLNIMQRKGELIYWLIYIKNSEGTFDREAAKNELSTMLSSLPETKNR